MGGIGRKGGGGRDWEEGRGVGSRRERGGEGEEEEEEGIGRRSEDTLEVQRGWEYSSLQLQSILGYSTKLQYTVTLLGYSTK